MKSAIYTLLLALTIQLPLQPQSVFASSGFDFDSESPTYDEKPLKNDPATIQEKIQAQMELVCDDGMCTIVEKTTHNRGWSITLNAGQGSNNFYGGGAGTVIIDGDLNQGSEPYYGVTVRYENMKCTSQVNVPESVYEVLNTYIYSRLNEDKSVKKVLSDADRAALLEFVTLVTNAEGCRSNTGTR
jgi:hypothetical protein